MNPVIKTVLAKKLTVDQTNQQTKLYCHLIHRQTTMPLDNNKNSGVSGAATAVTSTVGNGVGGLSRTIGGIVGATGRGLGDTVTGVTGQYGKPVGDALTSLGNGVQDGTTNVAHGVEEAGKGKKSW